MRIVAGSNGIFGSRSWKVQYEDAAGHRHTTTKGFQVATHDWDGKVLDAVAHATARDRLLKKARLSWNELDESAGDRYPASMLQEH